VSDRIGDLSMQMVAFENAEILAGHEHFEEHLFNVQSIARIMALMLVQDGELAATWLRHRKPKKGKRIALLERAGLSRRTRAHSRNAADALLEVVSSAQRMAALHAEFMRREKEAPPIRDDTKKK
jgi:hypothetical protein